MSTETACPYCHSAIHADATVCRGCGAEKGYFRHNGVVFGHAAVKVLRVIALLIAAGCGFVWLTDESSFKTMFGFFAVVSLFFAGLFSLNLFSGPSWYR